MCAGKEFQVKVADTEKAREESTTEKSNKTKTKKKHISSRNANLTTKLVAWHSGRTSVSD